MKKKNEKKILIIAAHPDDEVLGCGGIIPKYVKLGYEVYIVFLTDGVSSRNSKIKRLDIKNRESDTKKSCKLLGVKNFFLNNLPDNELDKVSLLTIIRIIENVLEKVKPDIIYTHYENDLNIDHQITSKATFTATRFYKKKHKIFTYEVLSSTNLNYGKLNSTFEPNYFVDIKNSITLKIKALKSYKNEIRKFPHPRSEKGIRILANYRGMQSNLEYAEAFQLKKCID